MFIATEWEMFYTSSDIDEDLVNQICIDVKRKRYILEINAPDMVTDGEDGFGNEIYSLGVSKFVFDILVKGVKDNHFTEYKPCE